MTGRLKQQAPTAFGLAGVMILLGAGLLGLRLSGAIADDGGVFWPVFMLTAMVAGGSCAAGLLGTLQFVRDRAPVRGRIGAWASAIAAVSALALLALALVGVVVIVWMGQDGEAIEPLFAIGMVAMLGGLLFGLPFVGAAVWRSGPGMTLVGALLIAGGLLFLFPLSEALLGWRPPDWLPPAVLGVWGAIFLSVSRVLKAEATGAPTRSPGLAPQG